MADDDPIVDASQHKRRKLDHSSNGKAWDSEDDNSEDWVAEDFATATDTLPWSQQQKPRLTYTKEQFHKEIASTSSSYTPKPYTTQPTQLWNGTTQPTQLLPLKSSPVRTSDVLVDRSSPCTSPPRQLPPPVRRAPFAKPGVGFLASAMAPPGTTFRKPLGVQRVPATDPVLITSDSDEDDPPVDHGSDTEAPGLTSNLKPTEFKKGNRGLEAPVRVVKDSPRSGTGNPKSFSALMQEFQCSSSPASKRPQVSRNIGPTPATATGHGAAYRTVEDIESPRLRRAVVELRKVRPQETLDRCVTALRLNKEHVGDAMEWLLLHEGTQHDAESSDELGSVTPARGIAVPTQRFQAVKPTARQDVKAPSQTIAEKYRAKQISSRPVPLIVLDDDEEENKDKEEEEETVKPRRRLLQGRSKARSPSLPSSPPPRDKNPKSVQRFTKRALVIDDDDGDESDSGIGRSSAEPLDILQESASDAKLLKFLNDCSLADLADLSAQPEEACNTVLLSRPFKNLDAVRAVTITPTTKSGKRATVRPIGDKIVDVCKEMWSAYDAVDELVDQCERIAKPIQEAMKVWGAGESEDGELELMNFNDAQDSGIGTPLSSPPQDDASAPPSATPATNAHPLRVLGQPKSMNPEVTLKDYQLVGLNWLHLLWTKKISCLLADDMGLGKTCQIIAFLAYLQQQEVNGVHLVIVPGSTLENWLREFANFAPALNVVPYYGSQGERPRLRDEIERNFDKIDVIVTTYDVAVKPDDNKFLRKRVDPLVCVCDEGHLLRNSQSDRYQQLSRIPASFRVILSGTPLQNNLQELVSLLAYLMPDLFLEKREELQYIFKHKATTKETSHTALLSAQRIARARSMMTPFILRRKKQQVLDLPAKHSRVEYCDMASSQAEYYEHLVAEAQLFFADKKNTKSKRASSNILMSLRKAAIHPLLARHKYDDNKIDRIVAELLKHDEFSGNPAAKVKEYLAGDHHQSFKGGDYGLHVFCSERPYLRKFALKKDPWMDSGKVRKFGELITSFAKNGDRVLVFSQFTTMMNILEAVLETLNIKFMRLDGSTNMQIRQEMIDKFYSETSITVFMLSTKAGGTGINLACANKVIIFDAGFNPQEEQQAENRAHRVGQQREVEVVRLISRSTIEEQIHALGESKLALDERVAGEGASADEEKQAEKAGEQAVERLFLDSLQSKNKPAKEAEQPASDLKDAFRDGLASAGVKVVSKQAVL